MVKLSPLPLALLGIVALTPIAAPAADAQDFDTYTRGRTIHFDWQGEPYGVERYLPGQRVIWSFLDGRCVDGEWYAQSGAKGPEICFTYEGRSAAQCWTYQITSDGLTVSIGSEAPGLTLTEQKNPTEEMLCLGPEVGV